MARPSLKKRFGQHHLRSGASCRPLLDFLADGDGLDGRLVVEIGPGGGVLTRELVDRGARVWAFEVDVQWAVFLRLFMPTVRVVHLDAVGFPWRRLPAPALVTGNLPFNVGTKLIDESLEAACREPQRLPRLGYMVQKEVAERIVARPGDKAYGAFSVLVSCRAETSYLGTVPAGAFRPPPKVDAGFVGLRPRPPLCGADGLTEFRRLVFTAFSKRRKMLRGVLAARWGRDPVDAALAAAGIAATARAETLSVGDFVRLQRQLAIFSSEPHMR